MPERVNQEAYVKGEHTKACCHCMGTVQVAREIKLHIGLAHPSIISLYAAWKDRNFVYMALEWAPGVGAAAQLQRGKNTVGIQGGEM